VRSDSNEKEKKSAMASGSSSGSTELAEVFVEMPVLAGNIVHQNSLQKE
jgi:hypothetical protein